MNPAALDPGEFGLPLNPYVGSLFHCSPDPYSAGHGPTTHGARSLARPPRFRAKGA